MKRKIIPNKFIEHNDYTEIVVTSAKHGEVIFYIDKIDTERCKQYHWGITPFKSDTYNGFYAISGAGSNRILLHRFLMSTPKGMYADHINGDIYNNRRSNLRNCTPSENRMNARVGSRNKSGHKGVYYYPYHGNEKWLANIRVDKKLISLGFYNTYEEAVKARQDGEEKYFGEFRRIS